MHSFQETRIVQATAAQMFDVVMDIERYPEFLPWVAAARVLWRGEDELVAELVAELPGRRIAFRTRDRFQRPKIVEIRLEEGPFRFLESVWTFHDLGDGRAQVRFSIAFAFASRLLELVAGPMLDTAARRMVQAFEARVQALEGR